MFKHVLIIIIFIFIIICLRLKPKQSTFIVTPLQVKYPMKPSDFKIPTQIKKINEITDEIFYINVPWSSKNNNYIYDTQDDRYYIIDKDYYYYIPDHDRYQLVISKNVNVNSFKIK